MADNRPLNGMRVFEFGMAAAAPLAARYLAHFGAEVIKVESPRHPDVFRILGPGWLPRDKYGERVWGDLAALYSESAAGKLNVGLDLHLPEGRQAARRILSTCDVFISNYSPDAILSAGLDYDSVRAIRPDIIYLVLTAFGFTADAPYFNYLVFGPNLSALSGLEQLTGSPGESLLGFPNLGFSDYANAIVGLIAVLGALGYRKRTGKGQAIDLSQFESAIGFLGPALMDYGITGRVPGPTGNHVPWSAPQGVYRCYGDDSWVAISVLSESDWQAFCQATGNPEWATDLRFNTLQARLAHHDELDALVGEWTRQHSATEITAWIQRAGIAAAPVMGHADLIVDPQLAARSFWLLPEHARWGKDLISGNAIRMSETPGRVERAGPSIGQDNDYVLGEICGYSEAEIADMIDKGTVFPMDRPEVTLQRRYLPWIRHFMPQLPWPEPSVGDQLPVMSSRQSGERATRERASGERPPWACSKAGEISATTRLLSGYRILDLTDESGVYGTKLLADLGAEVIKVEPPQGSAMRLLPPFAKTLAGGDLSLYFDFMNTNKQSITLDLETAEGQAIFRRLAGWADAVVDTSPPCHLAERGIGYEQLRESNPRLVWVSLTPFGLSGPRRDWKGSDLVAWATSGVLNLVGFPGDAPQRPGGSAMLGYALGALNAAAGCLLALGARENTGRGQLVDISAQEAVLMALIETPIGGFLDDLLPRKRCGNRRVNAVPYGLFPCKDGYVNAVVIMPAHWRSFADWVRENTGNEAITEPIFQDFVTRIQMKEVVEEWVESLTLQYNKQELFEEAQKRGIPMTPANTVADLSKDRQLAARDYWVTHDHPELGRVRVPGAPCRLSETPWRAGRAPSLGEHNDGVYGEQLGIGADELASLKSKGVI